MGGAGGGARGGEGRRGGWGSAEQSARHEVKIGSSGIERAGWARNGGGLRVSTIPRSYREVGIAALFELLSAHLGYIGVMVKAVAVVLTSQNRGMGRDPSTIAAACPLGFWNACNVALAFCYLDKTKRSISKIRIHTRQSGAKKERRKGHNKLFFINEFTYKGCVPRHPHLPEKTENTTTTKNQPNASHHLRLRTLFAALSVSHLGTVCLRFSGTPVPSPASLCGQPARFQ